MSAILRCGDKKLVAGTRTFIMGVINVTPDSFSDGGDFFNHQAAIDHGVKLVDEGADIIDVGGFSTSFYMKPDVKPATLEEELARVIPVIHGLKERGITNISVDTMRAEVARAALDHGASWVNDQSAGLFDDAMAEVMALADGVVLMHNGGGRNSGVEEGEAVTYPDIMDHLVRFFTERKAVLASRGVDPHKMVMDPGVGFSKGLKDSLTIINNMDRLNGLSAMSLIGLSRKSFIGKITGITKPSDRDIASVAAHTVAIFSGVNILRTHNVRATLEAALVADSCLNNRKEKIHENLH